MTLVEYVVSHYSNNNVLILLCSSADSVLMLYSYAGVTEQGFSLFHSNPNTNTISPPQEEQESVKPGVVSIRSQWSTSSKRRNPETDIDLTRDVEQPVNPASHSKEPPLNGDSEAQQRELRLKKNTMSNLSIVLTLLSILVAFRSVFISIRESFTYSIYFQHIFDHDYGSYWRKLRSVQAGCRS